jgi:dephospho-CoA kinase
VSSARFIALTGGPGAGKTAVLEVARRHFGTRVTVRHRPAHPPPGS